MPFEPRSGVSDDISVDEAFRADFSKRDARRRAALVGPAPVTKAAPSLVNVFQKTAAIRRSKSHAFPSFTFSRRAGRSQDGVAGPSNRHTGEKLV